MGLNVTTNPIQSVTAYPGSYFPEGSLLVNLENNYVVGADANLINIGKEASTTQGPSSIVAPTIMESGTSGYTFGGYDLEASALQGGQYYPSYGNNGVEYYPTAIVYSGNGSTSTTGLNVRFIDSTGEDVFPRVGIGTNTETGIIDWRVRENNGPLAYWVAWRNGANQLKFAIVNSQTGIASTATVAICTSTAASSSREWNMEVCPNGDAIFVYKNSSGNVGFVRYDYLGNQVGVASVIENTSTNTLTRFDVRSTSDNGFVVCYEDYNTSTFIHRTRLAKYNSSNTIVGSAVTVFSSSSSSSQFSYNFSRNKIQVDPVNGNIFVLAADSSGYPDLYVYNSNVVLQKTINLGTGFIQSICPASLITSNNKYVLVGAASTITTNIQTFDLNGNSISAPITVSLGNASTYTRQVFDLGNVGYAIIAGGTLGVVSNQGVLVGTNITFDAVAGPLTAHKTPNQTIAISFRTNTSGGVLYDAYYHVMRRSIIGIAASEGLADLQRTANPIPVLVKGTHTSPILANTTFGAFSTPPGPSIKIINNTAILGGL